jgi:tetratricopeptide (TPR) repeat protein
MPPAAADAALRRARAAAAAGDWPAAYGAYLEAEKSGTVGLADLPDIAGVAYAAGHLDAAIATWERAHAELASLGEREAAAGAAVRVAMHLLFDTALMAPVRGWLRRAEQLLGPDACSAPAAWLAVVRAYERLLVGDPASAAQWAQRAVDVGADTDAAAAAIGRVALARLAILDGDVEPGLTLLDEAGAAAVSSDLDPLSTGVVYCEIVCALQGAAQYDLAEQWTDAMERWASTNAIGSLHGRCRVHRAEILRLRGNCADAEDQALLACEEMAPYVRRELGWPLTELGRIRLQRGDVDGAEAALLEAHRLGWDPEPALALTMIAKGEPDDATAGIRESLDRPISVPSKELPPISPLRRAPLLTVLAQVAARAGDIATARDAADELRSIAERFRSRALTASALDAEGEVRLAEGDAQSASGCFTEAIRTWSDIGAPYEAAMCRLRLADAHRILGNDRSEARERAAAQAVLDQLAAPADTGPTEPRTPTEENVLVREGDFWTVSFAGSQVLIRDSRGMQHLARLLAEPGRELHVLDLAGSGEVAGDAGSVLDATAKEMYRRRLADIAEDIEEATENGDDVRAAQAQVEREFLVEELARAVGLGGRDRRASDNSERARAAVTQALRKAIDRLRHGNPQLGEHLDRTIRTGTYCAYLPDPRVEVSWRT